MISLPTVAGVAISGSINRVEDAEILSLEAQTFLATLQRTFNGRRLELLQQRRQRQLQIDAGHLPNFLAHTAFVRNDKVWKCAPPAPGLIDRRVEITGPVDRKMVINALNSGATQFMADFEGWWSWWRCSFQSGKSLTRLTQDSNSPTWENCVQGQVNMRDAVARTVDFTAPNGKQYKLKSEIATLLIRCVLASSALIT